jgi:hypothetical protein
MYTLDTNIIRNDIDIDIRVNFNSDDEEIIIDSVYTIDMYGNNSVEWTQDFTDDELNKITEECKNRVQYGLWQEQ